MKGDRLPDGSYSGTMRQILDKGGLDEGYCIFRGGR